MGGTGALVVWYQLVGPDVDRWLPSMPALITELEQHAVQLADLAEADASDTTTEVAA
ncbi:hypothetical protein GCM10009558_002130 [Virgisporangium aurantiacum]